jgi:DNA adenine methylase
MYSNDSEIMGKKKKTRRVHPLKWYGGKFYLAKWIVNQFPPHLHYVEPFFGGGAVFFARDPNKDWFAGDPTFQGRSEQRGCSEVINDIHGDLVNFYKVVRDSNAFYDFSKQVRLQPFCEHVWMKSQALLADPQTLPVPRAVAFFFKMRMSRQGMGSDFATLTRNRTRGRISEQVNAYLGAVENLVEVHERLQRVVILNRDAIDVIKTQDGPRTLFYLDPPYMGAVRERPGQYDFELADEQHEQLLETLSRIEGKFLLSGYANELYNTWADRCGWSCETKEQANHASSKKVKDVMVECLWKNWKNG